MRFVTSLLVFFLIVSAMPAFAQLLSANDIIENIEGEWAVPHRPEGADDLVVDCLELSVKIWLREENGETIYYSQFQDDVDNPVERAPIRVWAKSDGELGSFLLIQYDGETRTTDAGDLVKWRLIMPDNNSFTWQRTDWPTSGLTPMRQRCLPADATS